MRQFARSFVRDEAGATAVEYGLMVALIAVAILGVVTALGGNLAARFSDVELSTALDPE
jgi:pilus assembly protein Flp/PilA